MNIEAFLLCDAATDQQGKLNILGAFDNIFAKKMPTMHPACAVAARIRFEKIEEGSHPIRIRIIDEDGKSIGPKLEGNVNVRIGDDVDSTATNIVLNIQRLKLENYGQYRIDLAIDNQIKASLPFNVREIPNQTKLQKNINNE
ncbi:hypothetical protein ES703_46018 [subsurface metagenome]